MRYRGILILVAAPLAIGAVAGCGGDDGATTAADTGAAAGAVTVKMGDFFFDPKDATAATEGGSVTISAPNDGNVVHELVLAKTSTQPGELPTTSDGTVDEAKLEAQGENAGEIADVEPGATKQVALKLTPGKYVMFCNLPGHYAQGMYGTFTVK